MVRSNMVQWVSHKWKLGSLLKFSFLGDAIDNISKERKLLCGFQDTSNMDNYLDYLSKFIFVLIC